MNIRLGSQKGIVTPALIIITGAFITVIYALLLILAQQFDQSNRQVAQERALHVAEAGINYYRWHLAHDPADFQDGTGQPGPYEHDYLDPQGSRVGQFSLEITPPEDGSTTVTITSTGWTDNYPSVRRTITAQYGKLSFSRFSFLSNASSWYGTGVTVNGRIHSNGGIRMDGVNTSIVSSSKDIYKCGSETGCHPPVNKPGIWGSGPGYDLWRFPATPEDFDSISLDFIIMQQAAQDIGLYLDKSNADGYHLIFENDGSVRVYKVTRTKYYRGYSVPGQGYGEEGKGGCRKLYQRIDRESLIGTYNIADTPIIFAEDHLWVEGTIKGRVTVVAARFPIVSSNANIWIRDNLVYDSYDGSNVLGLIAENDIYFVRNLPEDFHIDGALMAQQGKIIRHGYFNWCGGTSQAVKDKLTINGALISYFKSYWNFGTGPSSGFIEREINYDTNFLYTPPPYFPASGDYEFISWSEE